MTKFKIIKTLPMIALLILVMIFLIQLKEDKNSILNSNVQAICASSICISSNNIKECLYTKTTLGYLEIKNNSVVLTQTNVACKEKSE